MGRIDDYYQPPIIKPEIKPIEIKPQTTVQPVTTSRLSENNFQRDLMKFRLQNPTVPALIKPETGGGGLPTTGGLFADDYDGIEPIEAEYVSPYSEDAKPDEAASFFKYESDNSPGARGQMFADALEIHKDDPEWIRNFMRELGKDEVVRSMWDLYQAPYTNPERLSEQSATIRTALETMLTNGDLTQEGMGELLDSLKDVNPYVFSEIFGKTTNDTFREMFIRAAVDNGNDHLEAVASQLLADMSAEKQVAFLTELDQNGKLNDFIKGAMAGQQEIIDFDYNFADPQPYVDDIPMQTLGGIDRLLQNAAVQNGYQGSTFQNALYPSDLQQKIFYAAAKGLTDPKAAENFKSDTVFKDALSSIFLYHFDDIFKNSISDNGSSLTGDTEWLGAFFENTMFAQPPSHKASDVLATVYSKVAGLAKATDLIASGKQPLTAEEQALVDEYNASSPKGEAWRTSEAAGVIGEWLGNFDRAYQNAVDKIEDDAAGKKALLDLFVGGVDKLTGLADLTPGANIAKDLLIDQLSNLPSYIEGKDIADGKAEIADSAALITDLNNLIWDTINSQDKGEYSESFEFIAGHRPTENGVG